MIGVPLTLFQNSKCSEIHVMEAQGNSFLVQITPFKTLEEAFSCTREVLENFFSVHSRYPSDQFVQLIYTDETHLWHLRFWNRDGSSAEACGNGTRSATHLLSRLGYIKSEIEFQGPVGPLKAYVNSKEPHTNQASQTITVCQGKGRLLSIESIKKSFTQEMWQNVIKEGEHICGVDLGNLHLIIIGYQDPVSYIRAYDEAWRNLRKNSYDSAGVNISYVRCVDLQKKNPEPVLIATWERGVGPTLSCGSASCAAFIVLAEHYLLDQIPFQFPGGTIVVRQCSRKKYWHSALSSYHCSVHLHIS
ncbi:hypothetical protein [Holospora curviuscula]|uniref:hypothetical protein n=1 Tax=Holospora curviuscula TaxID=1082868 RepID=UPI00101AD3D0|nr:hypothetical protein [Holospora curviuscula]